ncbi:N-acetylglucosaminyldiphosphodolichol N-acetylglucosaminyltransferase catalytic subunit alg13 [Podospora pseudocomata]|uniref:UDP-N-acetylglucosamine transferase subunit ALG13 n=1 Tax=Podospora pseudocomata TaxID=2093779 RepID=A0ABR0GEY7_9PEZI|nr:N-acetylglucosaminyldiphosphodolichol N-acetylglucosaminyltransferase catalytic subunit alg13 [Podospora pseudocomata]
MTTSTSRAATPPSPAYLVADTLNETGDSHHVGSQQKPDPERVRNLSRSFDIDMMPDNDNGTLPAAITNKDATCPDSDRSQDNGHYLDLTSSSTSTSTPGSAPQMASTEESPVLSGRNCFVTIGSIASFLPLLEQVITGPFLTRLQVAGFKKLTVQCGPNLAWFETQLEALRSGELLADLQVECFSYAPVLKPYMLECRGEQGKSLAGCVIAHAGAGTILEVRRYGAPLIVVPNPTLMDNHQLELAVEVQRQGWAVHGKIDNLPHAIDNVLQLIQKGRLDHLPPYRPAPFPVPEAERFKLFDWVVLTCYPEEFERKKHLLQLESLDKRQETREKAGTGAGSPTLDAAVEPADAARMQLD